MNLLELNAVVTSVDIGAPVTLNTTPLLGGEGKEALLRVPARPITATVLLQGAYRTQSGAAPAEDSPAWTTIATLTSASDSVQQIELPFYLRWNTTVADADGPAVAIYLEGVQ